MIETGTEIENVRGKENVREKERFEQEKKGNLHHIDLHDTEYSLTNV